MASTPRTVLITKERLHTRVRDTILGVEQMLLQLPQKGDKVEVTTETQTKNALPRQRTTKDVILPEKSYISMNSSKTVLSSRKSNSDVKSELLPGTVCVTNMEDDVGAMIEAAVRVTSKLSGNCRLVKMIIECPHYVPKRLKCDDKWYDIV